MRTRLSNLLPILSSPIDWDEIEQQYDEMVKYAAAMKSRTADPEAILLRFARAEVMHPTYKALCELGREVKTIFICWYLRQEALDRKSTRLNSSHLCASRMPSSACKKINNK